MNNEKVILEKVIKLLNVNVQSGATIEEAATSMTLAQKVLEKHHLSMSKVMALSDGHSNIDFFELKEEEAATFKANIVPKWMMDIIIAVNRTTQTQALIKRIPRKGYSYSELKIIFVGDKIDVLTALELFNFLRFTTQKLSSKHCTSVNGKFKQWRSFAEGCSKTLLNRSKEIDEKLKAEFDNIDNFDVSKFEITDDEFENIEEDDIDDHSLILYNEYTTSKFHKISEYLKNKKLENEQLPRGSSKIDTMSFNLGILAGTKIPLKVFKYITQTNKWR